MKKSNHLFIRSSVQFILAFFCILHVGFPIKFKANPNKAPEVKIDTVVFKKILFDSDLEEKINLCKVEFRKIRHITKIDIETDIKLLNKELKAKDFNRMEVVTGITFQLTDRAEWVTLMEWHFSTSKKAEEVETALNKLKEGQIWHTIVPIGYKWIKSGNKIYAMKYSPRRDKNTVANGIFECVTRQRR